MKTAHTNQLLNFADFRQYSDVFIETGTCYGRSVTAAIEAGYNTIKSVEAKDEYYLHCVELFKDKANSVSLFKGKSIDHLPKMLEGIDKPAVFWLDAHVSGEASAGYEDWKAKGEESDFHQHTALKKELAIVLNHRKDHIILIDDQNGPNADNEVYIKMISDAGEYIFFWYDEQAGETFYKDKVLVAIPAKLLGSLNGY